MSPVTPRLRDGESYVKGRSSKTANELLELAEAAGLEGVVKTTSLGYVVPTKILANYGGASITGADQPAVLTEPGTTKSRAEATNVDANAGDGRLVEGVETATSPAASSEEAAGEFNPSDATVAEVNDYLEGADEAERDRVLAAEAAGKARKSIIGEEK